jgi:hypothetical protein
MHRRFHIHYRISLELAENLEIKGDFVALESVTAEGERAVSAGVASGMVMKNQHAH